MPGIACNQHASTNFSISKLSFSLTLAVPSNQEVHKVDDGGGCQAPQ